MGASNIEEVEKNTMKNAVSNLVKKSYESQLFQDQGFGGGGQWDQEISAIMDNLTLKSLFFSEDWVFILIDLIASEISNIDMKVAMNSDSKNQFEIEVDKNHPLNNLISNPNPQQDYSTWMYLHVVEYCLMGNAVQWYSEGLNQLRIIPAENVFIDVDEKKCEMRGYMVVNQNDQACNQSRITFDPSQILHQRRPNPSSIWWGLSPFIPNSKSLLFNRYSQDYMNSFYLKQATGQMALSLDKAVSEESALRLIRSFEMSYTGRRNHRRTMLLPKGVDVKQLSMTIADQNLIDSINQNREKIVNILRIPKHALSLAETGSLGSEEHKMALRFMWTSAIQPIMKKIAGTFTRFFSDQLGGDRSFMFDLSQVQVLREDSIRQAELAIKQLEFKTLNEVRKDLFDLNPLEGGDLTPIQRDPEPEVIEEVAKPKEEVEEEEEDTDDKMFDNGSYKAIVNKWGDWLQKSKTQMEREVENKSEEMEALTLNLFENQIKVAVVGIAKFFREKKSSKNVIGSQTKYSDWLEKEFQKDEDAWVQDFSTALFPTVENSYDLQVNSLANQDEINEINGIKNTNRTKRSNELENRASDTYSNINSTTIDQIIDSVSDSINDGKSMRDVQAGLVTTMGAIALSRSVKISEHETLTAVSTGKRNAMSDSSKVVNDLMKVWINLGDERVRGNPAGKYKKAKANHWVLQAQVKPVKDSDGKETKFSNGLRYPRDTNGSSIETIRCRCDVLMARKSEIDSLNIRGN